MCKAVKDAYGLKWGSYLGKKYSEKLPGKIIALCSYRKGELLTSAGSDVLREQIMQYYEKDGKYPYIGRISELDTENTSGQKIDWQEVSFSFAPLLGSQGTNFCDSCTDSLLYKGKFIPMCTLEFVIADSRRSTGNMWRSVIRRCWKGVG
jgi:hypothetical protein